LASEPSDAGSLPTTKRARRDWSRASSARANQARTADDA
jgi:hypothetical protein